jgi:aryl-alcohol dehydrogenase-like predicted oxidoreductase
MTSVENSLRRLGTDHLDLYQMHRYDPAVDLDETLGALTDLVRAGDDLYVRSAYGATNGWFRRAKAAGAGRIRAGAAVAPLTIRLLPAG